MVYRENGINKKTDRVFQKYQKSENNNLDYELLNHLYRVLNAYTIYRDFLYELDEEEKEFFKDIKYDKKSKENYYKDDKIEFMFCLLSDFFNDKELKTELTSELRFHQCHDASIGLAVESPFNNVSVLTGFVSDGNVDMLHSVVEISGEDTVIMDYTQNLMMKKEDYIKTNGFRELSRVSKEDLKKEIEIMTEIQMKVPYYLFFRDEMMKDLKKNSKVLKLEG